MDKQKENKVVELSDEDLAKVVGGMTKPNGTNYIKTCMCDTSRTSGVCIKLGQKGTLPECQSCELNK